jgi:hypothetical protein
MASGESSSSDDSENETHSELPQGPGVDLQAHYTDVRKTT